VARDDACRSGSRPGRRSRDIPRRRGLPFGTRLAAETEADLLLAAKIASSRSATNGLTSQYVLGDQFEYVVRSGASRYVSPLLESHDLSKAGEESRLQLDECRPFSLASPFGALVLETARRKAVDPRALAVRTLLHLPRVASYDGWVTRWHAERELTIRADRLRRDMRAASNHVPYEKFALRDLAFEKIDSSRAVPVLTSLHYLRSARPGSLYFALVDPANKLPVSLCSVSRLLWKCVGSEIRAQVSIPRERVWDISRLYSIENAPANAISSLLSKVQIYFRHCMPSVDLLVTAVDPNLGFTGSSYRAANWQQWMTVKARPYLYENGSYVSPRQLRERFGTSRLVELQAEYPGRFQQSRARLLDSMIYCCDLNGETKVVPAQERRRVHR
jgi:hypothetical protein